MDRKQQLRIRISKLLNERVKTPHVVRLIVDGLVYRTVQVLPGVCSVRPSVSEMRTGIYMIFDLDKPGTSDLVCSSIAEADKVAEMLQPGSPWLVMAPQS